MSSLSPAAILYDSSGNEISVVSDSGTYRVCSNSKIAKGSSNLVHLDAIDTASGTGRLKSTLYTPDGEAVSFAAVPSNPESVKNSFVLNGSSSSLLVDGSTTPVVFTYDADSTYNVSLQEIKFILTANTISFGTDYFGDTSGPLTNGVLVEITASGNTGTVITLDTNESFALFSSLGGFQWIVSSKDLLIATLVIGGGISLIAGSSDNVKVTVRDDLAGAGNGFTCFIKGNLLGS